jgi:hypothetical protein
MIRAFEKPRDQDSSGLGQSGAAEGFQIVLTVVVQTIGDARKGALDVCGKQRPSDRCAIVIENNNWVGGSVPGLEGMYRQ